MREDGAKVAKVTVVPKTTMDERMPVWFAQTDPESFTSGILSHEESGKCMVRISMFWCIRRQAGEARGRVKAGVRVGEG